MELKSGPVVALNARRRGGRRDVITFDPNANPEGPLNTLQERVALSKDAPHASAGIPLPDPLALITKVIPARWASPSLWERLREGQRNRANQGRRQAALLLILT